jgi:hypothetical protein
VQAAIPVRSPAYVFNKGVKEENVRSIWLERYGVKALESTPDRSQETRTGG